MRIPASERVRSIPIEYGFASVIPRLMRRASAADCKVAELDGDCLVWGGEDNGRGYGYITLRLDGTRKRTGAHRAAWICANGDIPGMMDIDHLCKQKRCINTRHMELVSVSVNTYRKFDRQERTTSDDVYCRKHGRDEGKPYQLSDTRVWVWKCHICKRAASKLYRQRKKERSQ